MDDRVDQVREQRIDRRALLFIAAANLVTVGLAFLSLDLVPDEDYGVLGPGVLANNCRD